MEGWFGLHTHNLAYREYAREHDFGADATPTAYVPADQRATFRGYVRPDGRVGTRNYATGLIAGGAQVLCFTTGRGSAFGCKPAPSIKLATNTPLYERMTDDMDINCGVIADGEATVEEVGRRIFEHVLRVASGEATRSEELGYGDEEFVPWHLSTVL
ncbi:hypothetical protein GCM10025787_58290 [Saccharopolyspora rosea]|uniref:D-galactarate/Altronate dehydratase C-terminal domain-containing protein n=1 Tax=Saccharopolyspora rosea TaxID=524884 RepID=A0ABW3FY14_9PSEU